MGKYPKIIRRTNANTTVITTEERQFSMKPEDENLICNSDQWPPTAVFKSLILRDLITKIVIMTIKTSCKCTITKEISFLNQKRNYQRKQKKMC